MTCFSYSGNFIKNSIQIIPKQFCQEISKQLYTLKLIPIDSLFTEIFQQTSQIINQQPISFILTQQQIRQIKEVKFYVLEIHDISRQSGDIEIQLKLFKNVVDPQLITVFISIGSFLVIVVALLVIMLVKKINQKLTLLVKSISSTEN